MELLIPASMSMSIIWPVHNFLEQILILNPGNPSEIRSHNLCNPRTLSNPSQWRNCKPPLLLSVQPGTLGLFLERSPLDYGPPEVDRIWLWVYYNKVPIYPIFYLLKGNYMILNLLSTWAS